MSRGKQYTMLVTVFIIALVVRLGLLILVVRSDITEANDAYLYFDSAVGYRNMLADLLQGQRPSSSDMARAYMSVWPPLHPILLSLGFLAFGSSLVVARSMMIILSALTAPLVYLVTARLSNKRVAFISSIIFATYPSLVHFSFRLLSETTFIFIFYLMFYLVLVTTETTQSHKKARLLAAAVGCLLGLSTLARGTGLLWIPAVALWVGWRSVELEKRIILPIIILVSAGVTLLPWEAVLFAVEDRFVVVSTASDANLYNGNNPWLPDGYPMWDMFVEPEMNKTATEYSEQHGVSFNDAYRALALEEIKGDPVKFVKRGFYKLRSLWSADFQLFRRVLMVMYPPMDSQLVSLLFLVVLISYCAFLVLAIWGLWNPHPALRCRELITVLLLAPMATHFITIALPKHNIPLLAVLLPAAGHGLAHLGALKERTVRPYALATLLSVAVIGVSLYTSLPIGYSGMQPSSYYLDLVRQIDQWLGHQAMLNDRLLFRCIDNDHPQEVEIAVVGHQYEFADQEDRTLTWKPSVETEILDLVVRSQTATEPFQLQLSSEQSDEPAVLSLSRDAWQTWQPTNLPGVEYLWVSMPVRISALTLVSVPVPVDSASDY
jgi:4-amino-4-deoxy-L-arabinose transferase-like glycosyltransferase